MTRVSKIFKMRIYKISVIQFMAADCMMTNWLYSPHES